MPTMIRAFVFKHWYQFLGRYFQRRDWKFMNYGFSPLENQSRQIQLEEQDEYNRVYIQLYDHVASSVDLRNLIVLEVGCGRGGGADYITRYLKPRKMVGLDLSKNVIEFCNEVYQVEGLEFKSGNAEALPFPDHSFDVVINVESSHCYGSMEAFLSEVKRVLRPGGYLLLTDFRSKEVVDLFKDQLYQSGLNVIQESDITLNILEALNSGTEQRTQFINETIPKSLVGLFHQFAGSPGTNINQRFQSRDAIYLNFVLQKAAG
jgi:ubiquinone/menaquinone biosynthesis C-methylase UbiE